jgi:hypothetical protein
MLLVALAAAVGFAAVGSAGATTRPSLTKDVDANHDGVFNVTENVPKNVTYPWTVTYRLTIDTGSLSHHIDAITDNTTSNIGS